MLSKKICKMCRNKFSDKWNRWDEWDEKKWKLGTVMCVLYVPYDVEIMTKPYKRCHYYLEQLLESQTNAK